MRISLWQQFSSNNSSSYVIVGRFDTEVKARDAADTIRSAVRHIWDWYEAHPEERENAKYILDTPPTDAEKLVAQEHNIEFDEAIDWIAAEETSAFVDNAVTTYENYVYIAVPDETLTHDKPFAQLMRRLGAEVEHDQEIYSELYVNITTTAPDYVTAQYIKSSAEAYLALNRDGSYMRVGRPPWVAFSDGQLEPNLEQLNARINIYLAYEQVRSDWYSVNGKRSGDLNDLIPAAQRAGDEQKVEELIKEQKALWADEREIKSELEPDDHNRIEKLLDRLWIGEIEPEEARIEVDGLQIQFHKLWFLDRTLGRTLPAVVTWMRALGCVNVRYEFESVPYPWARKSE